MKVQQLSTAVKLVQGAVSKEKDLVELNVGFCRTTDGVWHAKALMPSKGEMLVSFNKLKSITSLLPGEDEILVEQKNINCVVKSGTSIWKLNLRDDEMVGAPKLNGGQVNKVIGGHQIYDAVKTVKHLMKTDLSRPGLLSSWLTPEGELVCGDGSRLAGLQIGHAWDLELPNSVLLELYRILGVSMSENLEVEVDENWIKVIMDLVTIWAPPLADSFEREWYVRVRSQLEEELEGAFSLSKSELQKAIKAVEVVSGFNLVELSVKSDHIVLKTSDESAQKCVSRVNAKSDFIGEVVLDLSHLSQTVDSRKDEFLTVSVSDQVVEVKDQSGWEILVRKQA